MSIRSRIVKVAAAKSIEIGIVTVVRFFSVPLFLYAWSTEIYGEWLILYSFIGYFSLGNLGFAQASANEMTMSVSRGSRDEALRTFQSTLVMTLVLSAAILLLIGLTVVFIPFGPALGVIRIGERGVDAIMLLFAIYVPMGFFMGLMAAGYRCEGAFHRAIMFRNLSQILELGFIAITVLSGRGPVFAATAMLAGRLVAVLSMRIDICRKFPWLVMGFRKASRSEIRRLLSPSLSFIAYPAGRTVINQGVIIGIGAILGPVEVVVFSSIRTLTNLATRAYELINQAFYPEVSMAWGAGKHELAKRLHRYSCQASLWLGVCASMGLALLGPWVFQVWTHGKVPLDYVVFYGFVALVVVRALWYTSFVVPSAINRHQVITLKYLGASAVGLLVSILMLSPMGLPGGLLGFGLVEIMMICIVLPVSLSFVGDKLSSFTYHILRPPGPETLRRLLAR